VCVGCSGDMGLCDNSADPLTENSSLGESFTGDSNRDCNLGASTLGDSSSGEGGGDDSTEDNGEGVGVGGS
jgi:hypothetical protein